MTQMCGQGDLLAHQRRGQGHCNGPHQRLGGTDGGLDWMKTNTQQSEGDRDLKRMGW